MTTAPRQQHASRELRSLWQIPSTRANSVIADIFLLYARALDGWLSASALVELLDPLGVTETNARASLHRLTKGQLLVREPRGGVAGYAASEAWAAMLPEADRYLHKLIDADPPALADGWVLVSFSVPESERADRNLLRTALAREGYGCVSAGLWIYPGDEVQRVQAFIQALAMEPYVVVFRAAHEGFASTPEFVAQCWDLQKIGDEFRDFVDTYRTVVSDSRNPLDAFVTFTLAHNHFRRIMASYPGLPREVLPQPWPGADAVMLMRQLAMQLRPRAQRHVDDIAQRRAGRRQPALA